MKTTLLIVSALALTSTSATASEFNRGFYGSGNSGDLKGGWASSPAPDNRAAEREAAYERQAEIQRQNAEQQRQNERVQQEQQRQIEQLQRTNRYQ